LGLEVSEVVAEVCPVIALPASWEEYLASLDRKERHETRRKLRRIAREAEVEWYSIPGGEELENAIGDFIALHRASAVEKDAFMDRRMQGFFRSLARALACQGWLRLEFLEVNGERVAALLNFDYRDRIMVYNSGFDPQRYPHLSPGIVILANSIRGAIDLGRSNFDFLRGDEAYKHRLGGKDREIYQLTIARGS
jgi:CelD/BcsL family acetyltransferase involved in cellulose biosynthesis